jgi:hypothetical protein
MSLSRDYTAVALWREAVRDLSDVVDVPHWEKYNLINRAVQTIAGQFYDLMAESYMTDTAINYATGGKYDAGTSGTYTSATHLITLNSPSASITSADIEKLVVFRISTTIYVGKVLSIVSTSSFVFDGDLFPSADGTIVNGSLSICSTTVLNDTVSLSSLRIKRTGQNIRIDLASTATNTVKAATQRDLDTFRTGGSNAKTIVWCLSGDNINLKKGDGLSSYGTMTIHYPRVPYQVTADTDYIDLPDGTPIEIAIIYLRGLIRRRLSMPVEDNTAIIQRLISNLYQTFGQEVAVEEVKDKAMALKG